MTESDTQKRAFAYPACEEVLRMRHDRALPSERPGSCTAVIGSMTMAMKAQAALSEAAIRSSIAKISSSETHNGCAYGVDFPCTQSSNVRTVLSHAGIRVRQYLGG